MKCWGKWDGGKGRVREIRIKAVEDKLRIDRSVREHNVCHRLLRCGPSVRYLLAGASACTACIAGTFSDSTGMAGQCACGMMEIEGW